MSASSPTMPASACDQCAGSRTVVRSPKLSPGTPSKTRMLAQIVRPIVFLSKPGEPKANMEIVIELLSALGKTPLANPEPLRTAVRRAQKRWKLKLTESQGAQLV